MKRIDRKNINTSNWYNQYYNMELGKTPTKKRTENHYRFINKFLERGVYSLLDVGCGIGWGTAMIKSKRPQYLINGVDFSNVSIEKSKKLYPDINFNCVDIVNQDANEYDYIVVIEVLEHIEKPFELLTKLLKLAKRRLIVTVPNRPTGKDPENTHINIFTADDFYKFSDNCCILDDSGTHLRIMFDKTYSFEKWKSIQGWFRDAEGQFIEKLARMAPRGNAFEFGSYQGKSGLRISRVRSVNCVDNFCTGAFNTEKQGEIEGDFLPVFKKNTEYWPVIPIRSDHTEFLKKYDGDMSFVFVDGSHYYENAKRDIRNCYSKLVKGGIIAIHDMPHPEVCRAVNEFTTKNKVKFIGQVNATIGFMKCE